MLDLTDILATEDHKQSKNTIVTVLIATYNHAHYLEESLNSIRENYNHLLVTNTDVVVEVVVVDDGSTDQTEKVVNQFIQMNRGIITTKYLYQQNQGQSAAYENAIKYIDGDIICLLDSDDIYLPNKIKRVLEVFRENKEVGLVAHPLYVINAQGERTNEIRPKAAKISHGDISDIMKKYGRNVAPATSGLAFKKSLFIELHPNPLKGISCAADSYLTFAASLRAPVYSLNEPLAEYRQHNSGQYIQRMTSLKGLEKTYVIQKTIVSHFKLDDTLDKNSFYCRNIFAIKKMKEPFSEWMAQLFKLNVSIICDPFLPTNRKWLLLLYWNVVSLLPKHLFWKSWIKFQKIQTGFHEFSMDQQKDVTFEEKFELMDIAFNNLTMNEVLNQIKETVHKGEKIFVVTPNVDFLTRSKRDLYFKNILQKANLVIPDGMPIVWVSKLMKKPLKERVAGADLLNRVCEESQRSGIKIFLLGSRESVLQCAKNELEKKYQTTKIVGTYSPPFGELTEEENQKIIELIHASNANCLFVALGSPKQEIWIDTHLSRINISVAIGCGAAIDFAAGMRRAPKWMQEKGLEWFYRLIKEPRRLWKRYLIMDSLFVFDVLKIMISESLKKYNRT